MKIEKINDNQIRCTLSSEDLANRHLKLSELAYGTEKIQELFREMLRQADYEYGFEVNNIPLVIEAIPMSADSIVLIITKVEDPEELDTRFSRFTPFVDADFESEIDEDDEVSNLMSSRKAEKSTAPAPDFGKLLQEAIEDDLPSHRFLFVFSDLGTVMELSKQLAFFSGSSSLYKDTRQNLFLLVLSKADTSKEQLRRACSLASEYGRARSISDISDSYLSEHCEILIKDDAIQKLG